MARRSSSSAPPPDASEAPEAAAGEDRPGGGSATRERRRQRLITEIIDRALDLLAREGYDALTVARLATEMDYAVGTFYRYFPSKDALVVAIQGRVLMTGVEDLVEALAVLDKAAAGWKLSPPERALVRIVRAAMAHEEIAIRRPAFFAVINLSLADPRQLVPTEVARDMLGPLGALSGAMASLLEEAVAAGALSPGDARRRAVIFWGAHQGILQLRKLDRFGVPELAAAGMSLELLVPLLVGWGAPAALLPGVIERVRSLVAQAG